MTDRRTPPRRLSRGLLAIAAACALAGPAAAQPAASRDYPPTYSSHRAPWYDPFRLFTEEPKKAADGTGGQSKPVSPSQVDVPAGANPTPAWKWYGYGTPTPGQNPLAPNGSYFPVAPGWYASAGTTPGAIPMARLGGTGPALVPDPAPSQPSAGILPPPRADDSATVIAPPADPKLPSVVTPPPIVPPADADWKSSPSASLRPPTPEAPGATLKTPVRVEGEPAPPPSPRIPPASPHPSPAESPDLRVNPAPGIVVPPLSRAGPLTGRPVTVRGQAPDTDIGELIRRACGPGVRVMDVADAGPRRLVVRLAGPVDAAWAARDRLARLPELAGWRVEFELVTALRP